MTPSALNSASTLTVRPLGLRSARNYRLLARYCLVRAQFVAIELKLAEMQTVKF